ncbi:MAG: beta-lactamase family protein [Anaerolineales bacterium]|nr:beta-lactamase family protein [Anaerolineales bacterium]
MSTINEFNESIVIGQIGKQLDEKLSDLIQGLLVSCELPGLAIGVVAGNQVVFAKGFGVKSIETRQPVSMKTIFHMASVSKPFTATALMQLAEQGKVRLDTPVVAYLPYFKLDDARYRDICIQQMLSHVSGMPDEDDYEWYRPQYDDSALERYVRSLSTEKLLSEPGEKYAYSNIAFECLGDVIAKLSGMSFDDYVEKHILKPAGMVESSFLMPEHLPANWASPHVRALSNIAWDKYPYNRRHGPSSTLHSNALEMCNWAITNLNRGNFAGRKILDPSAYDLLWKPWAEADQDDGEWVGLSWFISEYKGERIIQHGGGDTGFRTHFVLLPERQAAAIVLCNTIPAPVEAVAHSALDILLGDQPGPLAPYASVLVYKTLVEQGLDSAVAQWDSLKADHAAEHDFGISQFYSLYIAIDLELVEEAGKIAALCARILPQPDLREIETDMEKYQQRHPDNKAAPVVLRAIRR